MNGATLLQQAQSILDGNSPQRSRMASWLARSALEEAIRSRLEQRGRPAGAASMRSLLSCFEVAYLDQPALVDSAQNAWVGLSNACHHHAFQLTPTAAETQQLIAAVERVANQRDPAQEPGTPPPPRNRQAGVPRCSNGST